MAEKAKNCGCQKADCHCKDEKPAEKAEKVKICDCKFDCHCLDEKKDKIQAKDASGAVKIVVAVAPAPKPKKGGIPVCEQKKLKDLCNTGYVKPIKKFRFKLKPRGPDGPLQRPYQAIGILTKGTDEECQRTVCTNRLKHRLDFSTSEKRIPYYAYHSRIAACVNYGQHSTVFGWYGGDNYERHMDAGRYIMPWRNIMLKDGDRFGVRRNILENARLGKIPNYEHDTSLFLNRSEQRKYNVEDDKRVRSKIKYPTYADASKLIFPPLYANKSKYQISQRKAMGRILSREQYPNIFHKKDLLECLADCPDLPANERPA